jgi:hypothetical protein
VIADLGVNHVERFVFEAGFVAERVRFDYGCDLIITTFDLQGYLEPEWIRVQVKAAEQLRTDSRGSHFVVDLMIEDYNAWTQERSPVILIVYSASQRRAYWISFQKYFAEFPDRKPRHGARHVRVLVPKSQRVSRKAVERMQRLKNNTYGF